MNITFKQLRYFEALARHGHFGRAADACAISQPALSVQIKELESTLGTALFERGARQVRLTAFGEDWAQRVRDILQAVDELGDMARAAQSGLAGRLRIGVIPTIAPYLLPGLIGALGRSFPDLDVHVRETVTQRLIEELHDGQIDTAIVALPVAEPGLAELALFDESCYWSGPKRTAPRQCRRRQTCATCGCCCWKKAIVSAIRRCLSATCNRRWPATVWMAVHCPRWCRWWVRALVSR
jgi:transcriptional regulator, LysR family